MLELVVFLNTNTWGRNETIWTRSTKIEDWTFNLCNQLCRHVFFLLSGEAAEERKGKKLMIVWQVSRFHTPVVDEFLFLLSNENMTWACTNTSTCKVVYVSMASLVCVKSLSKLWPKRGLLLSNIWEKSGFIRSFVDLIIPSLLCAKTTQRPWRFFCNRFGQTLQSGLNVWVLSSERDPNRYSLQGGLAYMCLTNF